jgi:hypothetical protein
MRLEKLLESPRFSQDGQMGIEMGIHEMIRR